MAIMGPRHGVSASRLVLLQTPRCDMPLAGRWLQYGPGAIRAVFLIAGEASLAMPRG